MYPAMGNRSKRRQDHAIAKFFGSVPRSQRVSGRVWSIQPATVPAGERVFLAVPARDIGKARALGAEWDHELRACWIPRASDKTPFSAWIVDDAALRAAGLDRVEVLADFADAMQSYGLVRDTPIPDGKWHCAMVMTKAGPRSHGGYILNLDGEPRGYIRNFVGGSGPWRYRSALLSREQRAALEAQNLDRQAARAAEVRREQQRVAQRTLNVLTKLPRIDGREHPYLKKKGVSAHGLRVASPATDDMCALLNQDEFRKSNATYLVIPGRDMDDRLATVQAIGPDGFKMFVRDARKKGAFHLIGARRTRELAAAAAVLFAEGYATGASLHEATGLPVVVAFDASNLVEVARQFASYLSANQPKIVCCDNDQYYVESALAKIAEIGGSPEARATAVRVRAGTGSATREIQIKGAHADGRWHQTRRGKYRLSLESVRGIVRALTLDVVVPGKPHVRVTTRNTGVECGEEAARLLRAHIAVPAFVSLEKRSTDFNDLDTAEGRACVAAHVQTVLPFELAGHRTI
jgi:putative DNA primase/helicase